MEWVRSALARFGGGLPTTFWWLWAGTLASSLAMFVFPFLALFLSERGFTVEQAGLVAASFGGGSILAGPLGGHLADRLGRRPTLIAALAATSAVTALLGFLQSASSIAAAVLVLGIVANAHRPAVGAMTADLVAPAERPRAFGLLYWAVNLGMAVSLVVGGALAAYGYVWLFLADAATTLVFTVLVFRNVPETRPADASPATAAGTGGYGRVLEDRALVSFLFVNFAFVLSFWQFQVAMPLDMARHGLGPAAFGRVLAINGLLIATAQPFLTPWALRFDSGRVLAAASLLVGLGFGGFAFCSTALQYAAATAVWTVGEILALPVAHAVVADLSPESLRGRYQGAFSLSWGLGVLAAPIAGASVMQRLGAPALWSGCLALGVLVALAHLALAGPRRRALAERGHPRAEVA